MCLGPPEEGTYTSQRFEPALTFTVPAGCNNPWDTRGSFDLWTPGWSDGADDPDDPGIYLFRHPGLSLVRDPRPDEGCCPRVDATVGTSAIELATWVANRPGVATRGPSPFEVGGLAGYRLDVSIAETWRESCPDCAGLASVSLFEKRHLARRAAVIQHAAADPARSAGRRKRRDRDRREAGGRRDAGRALVRVRPELRSPG